MRPRVLVVMPSQRRLRLLPILEQSGMDVYVASHFHDALQKLSESASFDLLFVDAELPDGSWQSLLESVLKIGKSCEMIVCSRLPDEQLWAEVLQSGAYDLIPEPYDEREVARIARSAIDSQYLRRFGRAANSPAVLRQAS